MLVGKKVINQQSLVNALVQDVRSAGGKAVGCNSAAESGDEIIEKAISSFGSVHVLINNSSAQRAPAWSETRQSDWDSLLRDDFGISFQVRTVQPLPVLLD